MRNSEFGVRNYEGDRAGEEKGGGQRPPLRRGCAPSLSGEVNGRRPRCQGRRIIKDTSCPPGGNDPSVIRRTVTRRMTPPLAQGRFWRTTNGRPYGHLPQLGDGQRGGRPLSVTSRHLSPTRGEASGARLEISSRRRLESGWVFVYSVCTTPGQGENRALFFSNPTKENAGRQRRAFLFAPEKETFAPSCGRKEIDLL